MTLSEAQQKAAYAPDWLVQLMSCSPEQELSRAEQKLKVLPELSSPHLQALLCIIPLLQQKLIRSRSGMVSVSEQFLDTMVRGQDRKSTQELLKILGGLRVGCRIGTSDCYFEKVILRESQSYEYGDCVHHFQFSGIGIAMMTGFLEPYYFLDKISFASFEVLRFFTLNRDPFAIDESIWQSLSQWERTIYLRLLSCQKPEYEMVNRSITNLAPFDAIFFGNSNQGEHEGRPAIGEIRKLGQKFVSLGVLDGVTNPNNFPLKSNKANSLSLCWNSKLTKVGDFNSSSIATLMTNEVYERLACRELPSVLLGLVDADQREDLITFALKVAANERSTSDLRGQTSNMLRNSMLLINPALLYLDWSLRVQRTDVYRLPLVLSGNSLFQTFGLSPRVSIEAFEHFINTASNHADEVKALLKISRSTLAKVDDWDYEALAALSHCGSIVDYSSMQTQPSEPSEESAGAEPLTKPFDIDVLKPIPVVTDLIKESLTKAPLIEPVMPKALLRSTAEKELSKMEANDPEQYRKLKERYLESLDPVRLGLIDDLSSRMGSSVFKTHLRHGLLKYMIENPNCWSSSHSEKMYPWL